MNRLAKGHRANHMLGGKRGHNLRQFCHDIAATTTPNPTPALSPCEPMHATPRAGTAFCTHLMAY